MMKQEDSKLLLGIVLGAAVGVGAAYLVHAARKGHWMAEVQHFAGKVKKNVGQAVAEGREDISQCARHTFRDDQ